VKEKLLEEMATLLRDITICVIGSDLCNKKTSLEMIERLEKIEEMVEEIKVKGD
jgi:hypothetical protein